MASGKNTSSRLKHFFLSQYHYNYRNFILLGLLTVIWGSSYILIKKGLILFSPLELACLRISISFLASIPFLYKAFRTIPRDKYFMVLLTGIFGSGLPAFLFALSMTKSGSAINGIINSLSPLWTLIIGYYLFKVDITKQKTFGVLIGFIGALVLVLGKREGDFSVHVLYSMLPVIATFCYGMSTNLMKQNLQSQNPIYTTSLAMMMIGIPALCGLFMTSAPEKIMSTGISVSLLSIAFLAIFGTLIAWMLFYYLVQRTDALFGASVTYIIPLLAVSFGILDGEVLSIIQLGGMILILTGVYFTTKPMKTA